VAPTPPPTGTSVRTVVVASEAESLVGRCGATKTVLVRSSVVVIVMVEEGMQDPLVPHTRLEGQQPPPNEDGQV